MTSPRSPTRMVLLAFALALLLIGFGAWALMVRMPGRSHRGALPPLTAAQRSLSAELERDVGALARDIGERSVARPEALAEASRFLQESLRAAGLEPRTDEVRAPTGFHGVVATNVWVEVRGARRAEEIVLLGAHYDSVVGCPGANDNATGVAAVLALARRFARAAPAPAALDRTLRFVAFVGEEPPAFQTEAMGSLVHARACRARGERIVAMLSLETLGCYSDEADTQSYPLPLLGLVYPSRGDFVAFVGNVASGSLVRSAVGAFRESTAFPSQGAALPGWIPGIGWSDQWALWEQGYPALMVTDTAPFRYPHYHLPTDTPDQVDHERLVRVVEGLAGVVARLAMTEPETSVGFQGRVVRPGGRRGSGLLAGRPPPEGQSQRILRPCEALNVPPGGSGQNAAGSR